MGLFDAIRERIEMIDPSQAHPPGHGFDPSVCEGCRHRVEEHADKPCDLCGCSTRPMGPMDMAQAPPQGCIRMDEHAR